MLIEMHLAPHGFPGAVGCKDYSTIKRALLRRTEWQKLPAFKHFHENLHDNARYSVALIEETDPIRSERKRTFPRSCPGKRSGHVSANQGFHRGFIPCALGRKIYGDKNPFFTNEIIVIRDGSFSGARA